MDSEEDDQKGHKDKNWQNWINTRLPEPEQQRELQAALERMHRKSSLARITGCGFVFIGLWIITKGAEAIITLYVQQWWAAFDFSTILP